MSVTKLCKFRDGGGPCNLVIALSVTMVRESRCGFAGEKRAGSTRECSSIELLCWRTLSSGDFVGRALSGWRAEIESGDW